ncbi:hypothetical protein CEXT_3541 [Caerostris extrusa]|uniref:Uncharacterized protein n=1 Tax=Caerostris extrusa TaxID=172846 RepID=A0AAV4XRS5_CAEEX|nr:hypothetical protein CEXT_3541 [Caerostris extrusa]
MYKGETLEFLSLLLHHKLQNTILNSSASSSLSITSKVSNSATKVPKTITNSAFNSVVSRTPPPNAIATTSKAVALNSPLLVNLLQSETSNIQQNNKLMPPPSPASNQAVKRKTEKPRKQKR